MLDNFFLLNSPFPIRAVRFSQIRKVGEPVERGEPLLVIRARSHHVLRSVIPLLGKAVVID